MQWVRRDAADGDFTIEATALDDSAAAVASSCADIWKRLETEVLTRQQSPWDLVRLEVWPDSGRSILFPSRSPFTDRSDEALAQVQWPHLVSLWNACEGDDGLSDDEFDHRIDAAVAALLDSFEAAYRAHPWGRPPRVECYSYEALARSF